MSDIPGFICHILNYMWRIKLTHVTHGTEAKFLDYYAGMRVQQVQWYYAAPESYIIPSYLAGFYLVSQVIIQGNNI